MDMSDPNMKLLVIAAGAGFVREGIKLISRRVFKGKDGRSGSGKRRTAP